MDLCVTHGGGGAYLKTISGLSEHFCVTQPEAKAQILANVSEPFCMSAESDNWVRVVRTLQEKWARVFQEFLHVPMTSVKLTGAGFTHQSAFKGHGEY